ncbi:MAG: hypothetical protein L3J14_00755 [Flavobacteriaceae bacterium]|nr:hypothetical protein [Flavobacteriaceae bacterium]
MYRELFMFTMLFFFFGFSYAQNPVEMVVDTTNIRIGEQIEYKIIVDKQENVLFPKLILDSLKKVEVVKELKIDTTETKYIKKYLLTSFDSGRYMIPKQKVLINNKKHLIDSLFIDVATVKVDTLKQKLYEIKSIKNQPIIFDDYKNYLWIGLAILALILLLIWYFFIRNKKEKIPLEERIPPYELAMQRLGELDKKQLWQHDKVKQYYVELTDIVRSYIERELKIPALESTTDELIESITDFKKIGSLDLPKQTIKNLQKLLQEADLVKFAKFKPVKEDIEGHRVDTENIINNLKPKQTEKEDEVVE